MGGRFVLFTLLAFVSANGFAGDADFVPFVISDDPDGTSLISYPHEGPIGTDSIRIETSGEHFVRDGKRVRIWGVNTSFSGNLPDHDKAQRMAKRLAASGVNCVRLHHMDTSRWPNGLWHPSTGATLYPAALERLDYFIDQIAQLRRVALDVRRIYCDSIVRGGFDKSVADGILSAFCLPIACGGVICAQSGTAVVFGVDDEETIGFPKRDYASI